jgi:membrane-associated phospholipid phosphatase
MKPVKMRLGIVSVAILLMSYNGFSQSDPLMKDTLSIVDTLSVDSAAIINTSIQSSTLSKGKPPVYKLKPAVDIPIAVGTAAWSIYGFSQIYSKDNSSVEEIQSLRVSDINKFDRWAADVYSEKAADVSDILFYGAMPLPLLFLADKEIRKDFGKISFLYFQTMSVTGLFYTGVPYLVDRYRPYAYHPDATMGDKQEGNAKNSFFAGHVALVATSTFFMAKVYSDYHPDSKLKYWLYGAAAAATGVTSYLRHRGGRHFPSDILVGLAQGTLTGILVPHFHKNKLLKNSKLSIMPYSGRSHGLFLTYKL